MPQVMTVRGPSTPEELGITMCHVHVLSELKFSEQSKPTSSMTPEEIEQRAVDAQAAEIERAEREATAAAKADAKLTAQAKLAALGLTGEEVAALTE